MCVQSRVVRFDFYFNLPALVEHETAKLGQGIAIELFPLCADPHGDDKIQRGLQVGVQVELVMRFVRQSEHNPGNGNVG